MPVGLFSFRLLKWARHLVRVGLVSFLAVSSVAADESEQLDLSIIHSAPGCVRSDVFPVIRAEVAEHGTVRTAKVYFRSEPYADYYYVEMTLTEGQFEAVLPKPNPETSKVIYYIEVVDSSFNGTRTEEHDPNVDKNCIKDPAFIYTGGNPGIVIGALEAGASALPPGFQAAGIAGVAVGGGIGTTTVVAVAAGAAGAAGVGVVAASGETTTTSVTPTPPSTTIPSGSVTTTLPGTTTIPGVTTTTVTTTTVTTTTSVPGGSTTTTSTPGPSTTTTTTTALLKACFTTEVLTSCFIKFDARCSTGNIVSKRWELDTTGLVGGPFIQVTPADVYNHDFGTCSAQTITAKLTVTDDTGQTDSVTGSVTLPTALKILQPEGHKELETSFASRLTLTPPGQAIQGRVVINDSRQDVTNGTGEFRHQFIGNLGKNTVEAHITAGVKIANIEGFWRFDFSGTEHFALGSLRVEQGQSVSVSGNSVVFRVTRRAGRIRFNYRLK